MPDKFTHNDPFLDAFKDGLEKFEPSANPAEMQNMWSNVKSNLPVNVPGSASNAGANATSGFKSILTIKGISITTSIIAVVAAAVITLSSINKEPKKETENTALTEQIQESPDKNIVSEEKALSSEKNEISTDKNEIVQSSISDRDASNQPAINQNTEQQSVSDNPEQNIQKPNTIKNPVALTEPAALSKNLLSIVKFSDTSICCGESVEIFLRDYSISKFTKVYLPYRVERFYNGTLKSHFNKAGTYEIRLVYNDDEYTEMYVQNIHVFDKPELTFKIIDDESPTIKFFNTSANVSSVFWNLGDYYTTNAMNPIHKYHDSGQYLITLIGISENECKDTVKELMYVRMYSEPYFPDIFTPNNDNVNETFDIRIDNIREFKLTVFDNENKVVFETKDINDSWNGRLHNTGQECVTGTYTYIIVYKQFGRDQVFQKKGTIRVSR